MNMETG